MIVLKVFHKKTKQKKTQSFLTTSLYFPSSYIFSAEERYFPSFCTKMGCCLFVVNDYINSYPEKDKTQEERQQQNLTFHTPPTPLYSYESFNKCLLVCKICAMSSIFLCINISSVKVFFLVPYV